MTGQFRISKTNMCTIAGYKRYWAPEEMDCANTLTCMSQQQSHHCAHINQTQKGAAIDRWRKSSSLPLGGRLFTDLCIDGAKRNRKAFDDINQHLAISQRAEMYLYDRICRLEHKIDNNINK